MSKNCHWTFQSLLEIRISVFQAYTLGDYTTRNIPTFLRITWWELQEYLKSNMQAKSENFFHWYMILRFENLLLFFIRAYRENSPCYVAVLKELTPPSFTLDHVNYSLWMPIYIRDMGVKKCYWFSAKSQRTFLQATLITHMSLSFCHTFLESYYRMPSFSMPSQLFFRLEYRAQVTMHTRLCLIQRGWDGLRRISRSLHGSQPERSLQAKKMFL